jgi:hypothetical protein
MALPYQAALARVQSYVDNFNNTLYGPRQERIEAVRVSMRQRRDYWHGIGSKIRRRMERERDRNSLAVS